MKITVVRNKGWYGRFRTAKIMADTTEIGRIGCGETVEVSIPVGAENLYAKMDWGKSEPYPVYDLEDGQNLYMNAWFTFNPLKSLAIIPMPIALENEAR